MNAAAHLRHGWCPGALRPMPTGDGLLARLRVSQGRLSLDQAEAIAQCARRFGNGIIEISSRANLQLRGIRDAELGALQEGIERLGLLDANEASESIRNIVASPIADLDDSAIVDPAPLVAALETRLAGDLALQALPAKFSFVVDGGGALPLGDVDADIRFTALATPDGSLFEVSLAGEDTIVTQCAPRDLAAAASALARAFLCEGINAGPQIRRMRHLVGKIGAAVLFARAKLPIGPPLAGARRRVTPESWLGAHRYGDISCVGAAPALGRVSAEGLTLLARQSRRLGARDIRLTPWRALIVTGLAAEAAQSLVAVLATADFITDPANRLLAIVACAGSPACANAVRDVRADALVLASTAPSGRGIVVHMSGCAKGCAHSAPAALTFVARIGGYDLVIDGKAGDAPVRQDLSRADIVSLLARQRGATQA